MTTTLSGQASSRTITATKPEFPYRAPAGTLPTELPPSMDETLTSDEFYEKGIEDWMVRVGKHYVVKATNIPVPTVYEMYKHKETGYYVLVMEFVQGVSLKSYWPKLLTGANHEERLRNVEKKAAFAQQIRGYIQELRSLPSQGYYGGIWEQGVQDAILTFKELADVPIHPTVKTPSRTEAEWCEMMIKAAEARNDDELFQNSEWFRHKFYAMFSKGHEPKFTHSDIINRTNILVRPDGKLVPVSWAHSGWCPSYWEYCQATEHYWYEDDWGAWIQEIFEGMEYVAELGWMIQFRERMGGVHWFCDR